MTDGSGLARHHCRLRFPAMACDNLIELFAETPDRAAAAGQAAVREVRRIEYKYSRYRDDSIVSCINQAAGIGPIPIDEETARLLDFADACFEQSGGLFDISAGVLRKAWDFHAAAPPARAAVEPLLALIGWRTVQRDPDSVYLPVRGMEIDFGGFGKEYAADRAATVLLEQGIRHAFVNLGGDVVVIGSQAGGKPWQLGIQHPRIRGAFIADLPIASGAVATSGDYERYLDHGGRRYSHILDPRSGESVSGFQSVTAIADTCLVAGSLSTIAMLKGESEGESWLRGCGVDYLVVSSSGQISGTLCPR